MLTDGYKDLEKIPQMPHRFPHLSCRSILALPLLLTTMLLTTVSAVTAPLTASRTLACKGILDTWKIAIVFYFGLFNLLELL